jgi:ABC-type Mn2+/Zn2+ transport system permease subunit
MQGVLTVRGCSFNGQSIAVALTPGVKAAIVIGNLQPGGLKVKNEIGECAQIALNERAPSAPSVGRYELWVFALILLFVIALIFWKKRRKNNQAI